MHEVVGAETAEVADDVGGVFLRNLVEVAVVGTVAELRERGDPLVHELVVDAGTSELGVEPVDDRGELPVSREKTSLLEDFWRR